MVPQWESGSRGTVGLQQFGKFLQSATYTLFRKFLRSAKRDPFSKFPRLAPPLWKIPTFSTAYPLWGKLTVGATPQLLPLALPLIGKAPLLAPHAQFLKVRQFATRTNPAPWLTLMDRGGRNLSNRWVVGRRGGGALGRGFWRRCPEGAFFDVFRPIIVLRGSGQLPRYSQVLCLPLGIPALPVPACHTKSFQRQ